MGHVSVKEEVCPPPTPSDVSVDFSSPPQKRKRAKHVKGPTATPVEAIERPQTPEIRAAQIPAILTGSNLAINKPFFPFPNHFPVPGLIPPPLFQNVPFNLLGMPLGVGLRPPLGVPPLNLSNQMMARQQSSPLPTPSTLPAPPSPPAQPAQPPQQSFLAKAGDSSKSGSSSGGVFDSLRGGGGGGGGAMVDSVEASETEEALKKKERKEKKDKVKKKKEKEKEKEKTQRRRSPKSHFDSERRPLLPGRPHPNPLRN